jgi:hypothetical protein
MLLALSSHSSAASLTADRGATSVLVHADHALLLEVRANLSREAADAQHLITTTRRGCAGVLSGAPHNRAFTEASTEILNAVVTATSYPDRDAVYRFTARVMPLRWRDRRLGRLVRDYSISLETQAGVVAPPLCDDMRSWAATHFKRVPAQTRRFNETLAIAARGPALPRRILQKHASLGVAPLLARDVQLESELQASEERVALNAWTRIGAVLGVQLAT